jgi:hypothetical protein
MERSRRLHDIVILSATKDLLPPEFSFFVILVSEVNAYRNPKGSPG